MMLCAARPALEQTGYGAGPVVNVLDWIGVSKVAVHNLDDQQLPDAVSIGPHHHNCSRMLDFYVLNLCLYII